jgi:hypothetical protein
LQAARLVKNPASRMAGLMALRRLIYGLRLAE